jgi:hypothetical protein
MSPIAPAALGFTARIIGRAIQARWRTYGLTKNVAAAIFWMKARAQWREKHEVRVTQDPLANMSPEQLEHLVDLCDELAERERAAAALVES